MVMETEAMPPLCSPASSSLQCLEDLEDDEEAGSWDGNGDCKSFKEPEMASACPLVQLCPLSELLAAEVEHCPAPGYLDRLGSGGIDAAARLDAVDWILKVRAFYGFRPATAWLAVNYMDRFLSSNELPQGAATSGVWPWHLLSASCISVAAKMEETHVPLLIDLQTAADEFAPRRLVFEPKTVRRMELLLMSALRWRMRSVTPFDFIDHLRGEAATMAGVSQSAGSGLAAATLGGRRCWDDDRLSDRAGELILGAARVSEFLRYRPSELCAAAILSAAYGDLVPPVDAGIAGLYEIIGEETVAACRRLIDQRLLKTPTSQCPWTRSRRKLVTAPRPPSSPVGVLEAAAAVATSCGSCDSTSSGINVSSGPAPFACYALPPAPSPDSPSNKRRRVLDLHCTEERADEL